MNMGAAGGDKSSRSTPPPLWKINFCYVEAFFPYGGLFHSLCGALFAIFFSMWKDPHIKFSASAHNEDYNTQELNRGSIDNQGKSHLNVDCPECSLLIKYKNKNKNKNNNKFISENMTMIIKLRKRNEKRESFLVALLV